MSGIRASSWLVGLPFDKAYQQEVYDKAPAGIEIRFSPIATATLILLIFILMWILQGVSTEQGELAVTTKFVLAILVKFTGMASERIYAVHGPLLFVSVLTILLLINVRLWRVYYHSYVARFAAASRGADPWRDAKIDVMEDYINGRWQWVRFAFGVGYLLIGIGAFYQLALGTWPAWDLGDKKIAMAGIILVFIIFVESWIWFMRIRMTAKLSCIDRLIEDYHLNPRTAPAANWC